MKIILDTNIWISFLLGRRLAILDEIVKMEGIELYVSDALLTEIRDVAFRPKFFGKISLISVMNLFELINVYCKVIDGYPDTESAVRDIKDLYLLSMAENIPADYIVTGDKDLLILKNHYMTQIVTFGEFVSLLYSRQDSSNVLNDQR